GGLIRLPEKGLAITFDDGYKDNIATAAVMLKERGLKATFFVTTSYIDQAVRKLWADGRPREFMTWDDIAKLSMMGFEIGSHMAHHADLTPLPEDKILSEFEGSRAIISKHIGKAVEAFSYPYGGVDRRITEIAGACGYKAGCSSFYGWNTASTDPYILNRTEIDGYDTINDSRLKLYGYYD
ncbi:MAG: polysaccharide deacetylase family protein, partial [Candidatus Omnitrophota bacterium]|nr:polysaccharide deacetylase family protein [Candidatus Omnitrophota bacterium]